MPSNWWNFELTMLKLTMHFIHKMIRICQIFQRNFELTVFEVTVPDLYFDNVTFLGCSLGHFWDRSARKCRICPFGTWSQGHHVRFCTPCPNGETTTKKGSYLKSDCKKRMLLCFLYIRYFFYYLFPNTNRVFRKLTKLAIMTILTSQALLCEKNPIEKCQPQWE